MYKRSLPVLFQSVLSHQGPSISTETYLNLAHIAQVASKTNWNLLRTQEAAAGPLDRLVGLSDRYLRDLRKAQARHGPWRRLARTVHGPGPIDVLHRSGCRMFLFGRNIHCSFLFKKMQARSHILAESRASLTSIGCHLLPVRG